MRARRRAGLSGAAEKSGAPVARSAPLTDPSGADAPRPGNAPPPRAAEPRTAAPHTVAPLARLSMRRAVASDLAPLSFFFDTALRRDYFLRRGQLADMLRSGHHRIIVAEIETVLVGVAIMTRGTRLVNALIHPAYRGLGIGRRLVEFSGAREVRAKLDMSTGDPREFYRSMGFTESGEDSGKSNIELMRR